MEPCCAINHTLINPQASECKVESKGSLQHRPVFTFTLGYRLFLGFKAKLQKTYSIPLCALYVRTGIKVCLHAPMIIFHVTPRLIVVETDESDVCINMAINIGLLLASNIR